MENQIQGPILVGNLEDSEKAVFYRKTYTHVAFAILGFVLLEYIFIGMFEDVVVSLINLMLGSGFSWLIVIKSPANKPNRGIIKKLAPLR